MQNQNVRRLDTSLDLIKPHLPPVLMSPESFAHVRKVAESLPVFAVDFFGFECRLAAGSAPTDCALNLTPEGARMLAGRHTMPPPEELQGGPWAKIQRFYQAWGETRQPAYADAGATWLEFDLSASTPSPNLLFGYWPRDRDMNRPPEWLIDSIIPLLLGDGVSAAVQQNFKRCLDACPPQTNDFQIGFMVARQLPVIRLCVFDMPNDALFPYLEEIGWQGPGDELRKYLDAFRPHADFIGLHLDIGERVYPHIGVEPNFVAGCWSRQPRREPRWYELFDKLAELDLLAAEKRQALFSWIGHQNVSLDGREALLLRGLSHIKIVLRPGGEAQAKAYFGIAHRTLKAQA
jgi:hypothetical protein